MAGIEAPGGEIGILAETGQRFLQIEQGLVHVRIPTVFHSNLRGADPRDRRHLHHFFLAARQRLDICHELLLHFLGRLFSRLDLNENARIIQLRQQLDAQFIK